MYHLLLVCDLIRFIPEVRPCLLHGCAITVTATAGTAQVTQTINLTVQ
jgi:hypothetical protein